jgi:heme-degrading monooxygenase HmoA
MKDKRIRCRFALLAIITFASGSPHSPDSFPPALAASQAGAKEQSNQMIRVFYRWRIKPGREDAFVQAWAQVTRSLRAQINGSRGSLLLRDRRAPTEFVAVARWQNLAAWQSFRQSNQSDSQAARVMREAGELLSTEVLAEVEDRLDYSAWKGKMIRVYRIRVKPGTEDDFQQAWRKASIAITAKHKGAHGSLLLRDGNNTSSFVEIVRWDSLADWQAFIAAPPAAPEAFRTIFAVMTVETTEVFDEIENLLADATRTGK